MFAKAWYPFNGIKKEKVYISTDFRIILIIETICIQTGFFTLSISTFNKFMLLTFSKATYILNLPFLSQTIKLIFDIENNPLKWKIMEQEYQQSASSSRSSGLVCEFACSL